jgi:hypothetical protein
VWDAHAEEYFDLSALLFVTVGGILQPGGGMHPPNPS